MTKVFIAWLELPDDHETGGDPWNVATWLAMALDLEAPIVWPAAVDNPDSFYDYANQALVDVTEEVSDETN